MSIEQLSNLTLVEFLKVYKKMTPDEISALITDKNIASLNPKIFNSLFLQLNKDNIKIIIKNKDVYSKVLTSTSNNKGRSILNIIGEKDKESLKEIITSEYSKDFMNEIITYLKTLKTEDFKEIIKFINVKEITDGSFIDKLIEFSLVEKIADEELINTFKNKVKTNQLNPINILKINSNKELLIYTKFNLLVNIDDSMDEITLNNGTILPYDEIKSTSESQLNKLIKLLKEKENTRDEDILEIATKLFYVFGYDNARKIITDKFSNLTNNSIQRIVDFNFKDSRRELRTKNQNRFYRYEMIAEVKDAIKYNKDTLFGVLLSYPTPEKIIELKEKFKYIIDNNLDENIKNEEIKKLLKETINNREEEIKKKYKKEQEIPLKEKIRNKNKLDINSLKQLVNGINLVDYIKNNNEEKQQAMEKFLLGNAKSDNDCLLRLIINKEALGLNDLLPELINKFDIIETVAKKNNMSLYSVLDVIDIVKINFFALKPNEQDIFLSTLSKIISSKEYCTGNEMSIVKDTTELHVERKRKVFSSIPIVEGSKYGNEYMVTPFDAESLLSSGADAKNCFRISAKGEDFFRYCLTNKNAVIVNIMGKSGTKYICPIIRSGNAIHCNGIDPRIINDDVDEIVGTLGQCMKEMLERSKMKKERIEVATITDLHLTDYFKEREYYKYNLEQYIPIDCPCYTDFNKKEINNYIIAKSSTYKENKYYNPTDKYFQKRDYNYEYDINNELDKERLSLIVNSISYSAIDYKQISQKEKNKQKRLYKPLDVNTFHYIIGNKDWYIAIDENFNILGNILPYDERARKDYFKALTKVPLVLENLKEGIIDNGRNR